MTRARWTSSSPRAHLLALDQPEAVEGERAAEPQHDYLDAGEHDRVANLYVEVGPLVDQGNSKVIEVRVL